jgi:hypothetical protein
MLATENSHEAGREWPQKGEHIKRQLAKAKRTRRQLVFVMGSFLLLLGAWLLWTAIDGKVVAGLIVTGLHVFYLVPLLVCMDRSKRKEIRELEQRLKATSPRLLSGRELRSRQPT